MDDQLPTAVQQICASFTEALATTADDLLEGLYLRGSLCWGEFFDSSDIDFTAVLTRRPTQSDLLALESAHTQIWFAFPDHEFAGHHLVLDDLHRHPDELPDVACSHHGIFRPADRTDLNPVAWHELATRGIRVAGRDPSVLGVLDDPVELVHHARQNMATYWARTARELKVSWLLAGRSTSSVAWCTLGAARMHHLATRGEHISKSGGGVHILEHLDERWHKLATEALRIRERPRERSVYSSANQRGKDLADFVAWTVQDVAQSEVVNPS